MPNRIKESGDGVALQVTKDVRAAGLVEEAEKGDPTYRAEVRVYAFDKLLLVVDRDPQRFGPQHVAELVASCARDTKSVYQAIDATVKIAGHGYQVQLPPAADAGFEVGDLAAAHPAPNLVVVAKPTRNPSRLAKDLVSIRRDQVA